MSQHQSSPWGENEDGESDGDGEFERAPLVSSVRTTVASRTVAASDVTERTVTLLSVTLALLVAACFIIFLARGFAATPVPLTVSAPRVLRTAEPWRSHIPAWVERYNVTHLFDWTWLKNGQYRQFAQRATHRSPPAPAGPAITPVVVNDGLMYFRQHPEAGVIVDNIARLPNPSPHPLPLARSWSDTCASLHIDREWAACSKPQSELDEWLPATTRFLVVGVYDAFVDTGSCHGDVPGTVYTATATYHFQRWTNNICHNAPITTLPSLTDAKTVQHAELVDTIGTYLEATGHFAPQQLPRLLRLLATVPLSAKVLVAHGGIADKLLDVLIERGVVSADRLVRYDRNARPNHFARVVYRSEAWPYLTDKYNHYAHDRTDMQLVHRTMADELDDSQRDLVVLIKRDDGEERSIVEHEQMVTLIERELATAKLKWPLKVESFTAAGHIRTHIALFSRARVIIGPHGAGMLNVYWAKPGTHVVEVGYDEGMPFPEMYAEMSIHLDHKYWVCKGTGNYAAPIHVDMDELTFIVQRIIADIQATDGH